MFDVAVIGAGPAGCILARLLADRNFRVAVLEEHSGPGHPVNCSGIIGVEAFRHFDLPRDTILRSVDVIHFFAPGGGSLTYRHPEPLAHMVDRSAFDIALAQQAVSSGARLIPSSRVTAIRVGRDAVSLTIAEHAVPLQCRFVAVATGAGSNLPEQLGLQSPRRFVLGAQAECEAVGINEVEVHLGHDVAPANFAWVLPASPGRAKIGLLREKNASAALKRFLAGKALSGRIGTSHTPICSSLLPVETVRRSYTDRALIVGEAAGQIKAITCGGIYYGMLCAEMAADVLGGALRLNSTGSAALAPYEQRWKKILNKELQTGARLRAVFERLPDSAIDAMFDMANKDGIMSVVRDKVNFDWHHTLVSALSRHYLLRAFLRPRDLLR